MSVFRRWDDAVCFAEIVESLEILLPAESGHLLVVKPFGSAGSHAGQHGKYEHNTKELFNGRHVFPPARKYTFRKTQNKADYNPTDSRCFMNAPRPSVRSS